MSGARKFTLILLLGLIALLIPGTIFKTLLPQFIAPNLLVILLVYLAFYEGNALGAVVAFCLGLQLDLCSGLLIGPWGGGYVAVFCFLVLCSQRIFIESPLVVSIACGCASFLTAGLYQAMLIFVYGEGRFAGEVVRTALMEAGFTAVVAPFFFYCLHRLPLGFELRQDGGRRVQVMRS